MCLSHCALIGPRYNVLDIMWVFFSFLQETIISHLQKRYDELQVYTYVGDILIALNPFQNLSIYSPQVGYKPVTQYSQQFPNHIDMMLINDCSSVLGLVLPQWVYI